MKPPLALYLLPLLYIAISCKPQPEKAISAPITVTDTAIIPQITAPIYEYTDEEWNSPIDSCTLPIDINGLRIDCGYSFEELIRVFGEPTEIDDYWDKYGYWKAFYRIDRRGTSGFKYTKEYGIKDFTLYIPGFSIYNGLIEVGKPISIFKTLGCGRLVGNHGIFTNQKVGMYTFFTNNNREKNLFDIQTDPQGIITAIVFYSVAEPGSGDEEP